MKCIIIDDEATARAIIGQLCVNVKSLNVLEEFPNAIQAIKFLNQNEVDLIFLDIHMPDFTGFDFIEPSSDTSNLSIDLGMFSEILFPKGLSILITAFLISISLNSISFEFSYSLRSL